MSSQHKAPLAAFVVVSIALIVVVANAVLHDGASALTAFFQQPTQSLVSRLPMVARPHAVAVHEARAVVKAKAGLEAAPTVVKKVVATAEGSSVAHRSKQRHHAAHAAAEVVTPAPAAPVAASAPAATPPALVTAPTQAGTRGHGHGYGHGYGHGHVEGAQQWQGQGASPMSSGYVQVGDQSDAAPSAGKGWTADHDDHSHRRGPHRQTAEQASSVRPGGASSRGHQASGSLATWSTGGWSAGGQGNGWGNRHGGDGGRDDGRDNGWGNGWGNNGHHGRH